MMEYFQRRIVELEERLIRCDQNLQNVNQKMYDMSSEMRAQLRTVNALKSEIQVFMDGLSSRVERVERDVEYLHEKIPDASGVEISETLLEQQVKEAQTRRRVVMTRGKECVLDLASVRSQKIVSKQGDAVGSWMKDPTKDSTKIYFFSGSKNDTLLEFPSLKLFTDFFRKSESLQLPRPWQGTGHVVYGGFVFYHNADTRNEVLKVHLLNRTIVDRMLVPAAGRVPVYELSPHTYLHFVVDELGLWVLHADPDFGGNLVMTKLDAGSLAVEHTWDTHCKSHNAEGAFIICGTLYVVYNSRAGGRSSVQCLYDVHDTMDHDESPLIYFPKRYASHSGINYNPQDRLLYGWDDGYQTIYKLDMKRRLQVT